MEAATASRLSALYPALESLDAAERGEVLALETRHLTVPGGTVLFGEGELCVVSTSCLFGQAPMSALGQATESTELVLLSPAGFERAAAAGGLIRIKPSFDAP